MLGKCVFIISFKGMYKGYSLNFFFYKCFFFIDVLYGDINNDKTVNSTDVTYLKRFLLKQINSLPNQKAADVNLDGNINSTDLVILKRYVLRGISKLPYAP